jgi:hypothetical protein
MRGKLLFLLLAVLFPVLSIAQDEEIPTTFTLGAEFQAYPAGQMYGLRAEYYLNNKSELNLRAGYNAAFRMDFSGLNDNEQGGGWGFTPGYRYHFDKGYLKNFFVGARCDFWWLTIDWRDDDNVPRTGTTNITIVQPTVELGYTIRFGANQWMLRPTIAFGQEINVVTKGDEVGQGGISLIGMSFSRRLF